MRHSLILLLISTVVFFNCSDSGDDPQPTEPPEAQFMGSSTAVQAGAVIVFSDQSQGNPTSWNWTFEGGDPSTSTDQNPIVQYAATGSYDVVLSVTNTDGNDTETKSGYIVVSERTVPDEFDIVGIWERTESNNAALDGMQVMVTEQEADGVILDSPSSSFPEGELKWRNIQKVSEHEYAFEDRNSTGNYDDYALFILAYGNELIIGNFDESELGSFQRWERINFQYPEDQDYSLVDVWERTRSNAPLADGMRVSVNATETEGEVIETPIPDLFPVGAIKWNDIEKEGANRFVLNDLRNDGALTESRMFIVGKEGPEVVIGVFTAVAGSFQKWTRE